MSFIIGKKFLSNLLLPIIVILIHFSFAINHVIGTDEGVALYTGRRILDGGLPYVDSWDHKGPILYLFNALGMLFSSKAIWGPGLLEGILLAFAIAISGYQLQKIWSPSIVYSCLIAFLFSYYMFLESLDLTESWTLPFQFLAYMLIFQENSRREDINFEKESRNLRRIYILLGLSFSFIFYIRPNNATGIFLATVALIFHTRRREFLFPLKIYLFTFMIFSVVLLAALALAGSFRQFLEQFFIYNFDYSSAGSLTERFHSLEHSLFRLTQTPLILISIFVILIIIIKKPANPGIPLSILIGFLGDFASSLLSARGYLHYMIIVFPSLFFILGSLRSSLKEGKSNKWAINLVLILAMVFGGVFGLEKFLSRFHSDAANTIGVAKFLDSNTEKTDYVQILGSETRVLVLANRQSASSITYSHPATSVFYRHRADAAMKLEGDIRMRNPKFILRSIVGTCNLRNVNCGVGNPDYSESNLQSLYSWIIVNYHRVGTTGDFEIWQLVKR